MTWSELWSYVANREPIKFPSNEELRNQAYFAIQRLYYDTSVPVQKARENLEFLQQKIGTLLEALTQEEAKDGK